MKINGETMCWLMSMSFLLPSAPMVCFLRTTRNVFPFDLIRNEQDIATQLSEATTFNVEGSRVAEIE